MTENHWQRAQEIFAEALECAPERRDTLLNRVCADDADLRAEVESLLRHHDEGGEDFMRPPSPPPEIAVPPPSSQPGAVVPQKCGGRAPYRPEPSQSGAAGPHECSGRRLAGRDGGSETDPLVGQDIGAYRIESVLAAGGMGTVYLAEQQSPRRQVALKLLRAGIASSSALRRFEYEAEILAHLRHPNVAEIYEAGTHLGLPFFVMEFIPDAQPITDYAEQHDLSPRDRLKLFAQICDAVHHGHQRGIIHRDLKPANILVDVAGRVKVIDFGVARATDADIALTTLRTETGQLVGTLQYMSPEQCDADPHELDVRSDVYSLGMVLYELLCRRLPYDVREATLATAARVICEHPPPRPSSVTGKRSRVRTPIRTRSASQRPAALPAGTETCGTAASAVVPTGSTAVSAVNAPRATGGSPASADQQEGHDSGVPPATRKPCGTAASAVNASGATGGLSACANETASAVIPPVKADLERIILTALEKNRTRRYQSAADLLRDVRHYLNREPIEARPPTLWTRAVRWVGRHPVGTTTTLCFLVAALIVGGTLLSVQAFNRRPHRIEISPDGREARLLSFAGGVLHKWDSGKANGIAFTELVDRPDDFGGGQLALVAFREIESGRIQPTLQAFNVARGFEEPVWVGRITHDDALPDAHNRTHTPQMFHVSLASVADVFKESPGREVVVVHTAGPYSQCFIRIYDLSGKVVYQTWYDGALSGCYWMRKEKLLVFCGDNAEAYWSQRGYTGTPPKRPYPLVVFAIRAEYGLISSAFLKSTPGADSLSPVWHKCVLPPTAGNHFGMAVGPPLCRAESGVCFSLTGPHGFGVGWDLDPRGEALPGTFVVGDAYKQNQALPEDHPDRLRIHSGDLKLDALPPIQSADQPALESP